MRVLSQIFIYVTKTLYNDYKKNEFVIIVVRSVITCGYHVGQVTWLSAPID